METGRQVAGRRLRGRRPRARGRRRAGADLHAQRAALHGGLAPARPAAALRPDRRRRSPSGRAHIRVGDPFDPRTELGPLIHPEHHARVLGYVQSARDEGARVLAGGERPAGLAAGNFLEATVIGGRRRDDDASSRRRSSDRCSSRRRSTTRPMRVRLANATPYGLAAYVWTNDIRRGHRVAHGDQHGHVLDQLAERARPAHAVRRDQAVRDRPRGRRLRVRLLLRDRDRPRRARHATTIPRLGPRRTRRARRASASSRSSRIRRGRAPARRRSTSCAAAYAELLVTDLAASRALLRRPARPRRQRSGPTTRSTCAAGRSDSHHSLVLRRAPAPACGRLAFRVRAERRPRRDRGRVRAPRLRRALGRRRACRDGPGAARLGPVRLPARVLLRDGAVRDPAPALRPPARRADHAP